MNPTLRPVLRWAVRIAGGLIGLVLLLAAIGASYEAIAATGDAKRYPPPGRLVDIGGRKLHIHCLGTGIPAVIFDSGLGGTSLDWILVHAPVAKFTRACVYDRAGMGWSDPGPRPRSPKAIADDLQTLLINAKVAAPYVLVGHSLGGKNVRLFAAEDPDEVAGMVLIDARHEYMDLQLPPAQVQKELQDAHTQILFYGIARKLGIVRLFGAELLDVPLSSDIRQTIAMLSTEPTSMQTVEAEAKARAASDIALSEAPTLGDKPLVVLASGQNMAASKDWRVGQKKQAALSTNSRFTIATGSGHYIQHERPQLVIDAVREVVEKVRSRQNR
jgi:pimeloyl-ACP methyl ester carboxylesterase